MKTTFVLAALASSAVAFAPATSNSRSKTSLAAFENELGVQKPLGFWDPLNFCDGIGQKEFDRLRTAEIKHGRIAMMAVVGHMVTASGVRLPGCEGYAAGVKALTSCPPELLLQAVGTMALLDLGPMQDRSGKCEYPGDYRNGLFKWDASPEEQMKKRAIELNNGRAAQMGIFGLVTHELLNNEPYMINAFLGYPSNFNAGF